MKTSTLKIYALTLITGLALVSCKKEGCTDPLAVNYDANANHDNGLCAYDNTGGGGSGGGSTTIVDDINLPTTWSGNLQVCDDINVHAALTIQPGTVINMCAGASINIEPTGSISAIGTATSPIIIKGEVASAGYWEGIIVQSNNPTNQMAYVTVKDAGSYWAWEFSNLKLDDQAKLGVNNCTFSNSERYGFYATGSSTITSFSNNTFSNNTMAGLNITALQVGALDENSNYNVSNGEEFIIVRAGALNTNQVWKRTTTPLLVTGEVSVNAGLTIEPGFHAKFESGSRLDIETSGYLIADGTISQPITLEGRYASAGYWEALAIYSNNPNNSLEYVIVKDGGQYWADDFCSVLIHDQGRVEMNNCTVTNSNSWGMVVRPSCTVISGGAPQTDAAGVMTYNSLSGNGTGSDANCIGGGCTVDFQ